MESRKLFFIGLLLGSIALAVVPAQAATYYQMVGTDNLTVFNGSGYSTTWVAPAGVTSVEYLVVAGGGGGGGTNTNGRAAGGGGGGGVLNGTYTVTPSTSYVITVGQGGTAGSGANGGAGGNSSFANTTVTNGINARGGGYGEGGSAVSGGAGGSGGGGRASGGGAGTGTPGQGRDGAAANSRGGGGGGGNSSVGSTGSGSNGGNGGNGGTFDITGNLVVYAGGGGGGTYQTNTAGTGGTGGGGMGGNSTSTTGKAGTNDLGGGGGGSYSTSGVLGGAGGSGVVYLRYYTPPPTVQWSASPQSGNSLTVITFTDTSTGGETYYWNFNDGNTSTTQSPTHQFPCPSGICLYSINHSVTNFQGTTWLNRSNYITISNIPVVSFTANRTGNLGPEPQGVAFTDTSTNTPTTWGWNMTELNGTRIEFSTSQNPAQAFHKGNWSVTLTAGNSYGTNISSAVWENVTQVSASIALNQSSLFMDLDASASPATNASLAIIVSANSLFSITVTDSSGRSAGDQGYMGNYTTAYVGSPLNTKLANALALAGTANGTTTVSGIIPPITVTPQILYTGTAPVSNQWLLPNSFTQVVTYPDPILPAGSLYRMDLQFTITLT